MHCRDILVRRWTKRLNIRKNHAPNVLALQLKRDRIIAWSDTFPICCRMVGLIYLLIAKVEWLYLWRKVLIQFCCVFFCCCCRMYSVGGGRAISLWRCCPRYESWPYCSGGLWKVSWFLSFFHGNHHEWLENATRISENHHKWMEKASIISGNQQTSSEIL